MIFVGEINALPIVVLHFTILVAYTSSLKWLFYDSSKNVSSQLLIGSNQK